MDSLTCLLVLSAGYPIWDAWRSNRDNPLTHALTWAAAAWITWLVAAWFSARTTAGAVLGYLALCLVACAMIAVLGARRPGVAAWNFVVTGLLAVLLLPIFQRELAGGAVRFDLMQLLLLIGVLAVGVINYLPTRFVMAAVTMAAACCLQLMLLGAPKYVDMWESAVRIFITLAAWLAYGSWYGRRPTNSMFDELWLRFRDRFGLVWGQRLRDQFNRSAVHAGWPVTLTWRGLRRKPGAPVVSNDDAPELLHTLSSLMKRFGNG